MKYAILSDIHANLSALQAVLADSDKQKCDRVVCLGDTVGYGRQPKECVELMRNRAIHCVKGNFDDYCAADVLQEGFNTSAAEQIGWTREQLGEENREWLQNLPYVASVDGFNLVHSSFLDPHRWNYVFDKKAAEASFKLQPTYLSFFGHTHVPVAFVSDQTLRGGTYTKFEVRHEKKYFVNPGSVGQPRDNNPKAAYAIFDSDSGTIELRRCEYDGTKFDGNGGGALSPRTPAPNGTAPMTKTI